MLALTQKYPGWHCEHTDEPAAVLNVPAGQATQDDGVMLKKPIAQGIHADSLDMPT